MKQTTWPGRSDGSRFKALPLWSAKGGNHSDLHRTKHGNRTAASRSPSTDRRDYSTLPVELVTKIGLTLSHPSLSAASLACKAWCEALQQLRQAMMYMRWGKRFKHGRGGVSRNTDKALDAFLMGAACGSPMAMVDAGLIYWERGLKEKAVALYQKAAELGDPAGQCNLGISYLQAEPPNPKEAVKWLYCASYDGHTRAQYQLALCLHQGRGVNRNIQEAARWYLKAAEGGYLRAMYNVSLCYKFGEGLVRSYSQARKWMKQAADCGHSKAQYEYGVALFSKQEKMKAVVYLELATRAGESAAAHVKNVILQQLSATSRDHVMCIVDNWRASSSSS
ncbi:F-box protein [Pyrus ussuriensis x Pyrus communis]|uniref:F-box protein n=1 Tax=Pyrus ussuriensis x Pyrus communis TaxID=2448454 RepID=A0A5N5GGD7_9ROSA|nr:F-box protein [Pyrus ussuriensis x Pyrus communis]